MSFEILNRWTRAVVYSSATAKDISEAALEALKTDADLRDADLTGADLTRAVLRGADLRDADLRDADLTRAVLRGAVLTRAVLTRAVLRGAVLRDADLRDADLRDADLRDADLTRAVLRGAVLTRAVLTRAVLTPIRDDFWAVLCSAPKEVFGLRLALIEGRVDGSTYQGECACLVGTLANVRHCAYDAIPGLTPNGDRPAERFFLAIRKGDTPETSQPAKIALEWIDDWAARMREAFTPETKPEA